MSNILAAVIVVLLLTMATGCPSTQYTPVTAKTIVMRAPPVFEPLPIMNPETPSVYMTPGLPDLNDTSWSQPVGEDPLLGPFPYDGNLITFESMDRTTVIVRALDPISGSTVWESKIPGGVITDPLFIGGSIILSLGPDRSSPRGNPQGETLAAIDASDGRIQWNIDLDHIRSLPQISEYNVIVGQNQGGLIAVDRETGNEVWRVPPEDSSIGSAAHIHQDLAIQVTYKTKDGPEASNASLIAAYHAATGERKWATTLEGILSSVITARSGVVFAGMELSGVSGRVYALSADNGSILWQTDVDARLTDRPLLNDGSLYFKTEGHGLGSYGPRSVISLDAKDGKVQFDFRPGRGRIDSFLLFEDGLYVADSNWGGEDKTGARIYSVDPLSGETIWIHTMSGSIPGRLSAADGTLYISDVEWAAASPLKNLPEDQAWASGRIQAINARNGKLLWTYPIAVSADRLPPDPVIFDGMSLFIDMGSFITALR